VRITQDGRLCFDALPAGMLRVAAALCPDDPDVRRRLALLDPNVGRRANADGECRDGNGKADE
jgi:hypothetical protein